MDICLGGVNQHEAQIYIKNIEKQKHLHLVGGYRILIGGYLLLKRGV